MLNATVVERTDITEQLTILKVKPDAGVPDFEPGQYLALGLYGSAPRDERFPPDPAELKPDKLIKRAYSVGSSPDEKGYLELYIALVAEGELTPRLALIRAGDRIYAAPKIVGTFTASDVPPENNLVLVSTGTGIAPYLSMVRTPHLWSPERSITIIHGVRYETDFAYADELIALQKARNNFRYLQIVSRPTANWKGAKGHVQHFLNSGMVTLNPQKDHVFLCGNPAMIDGIEKMLLQKEYKVHSKRNPGNLHLEKYW